MEKPSYKFAAYCQKPKCSGGDACPFANHGMKTKKIYKSLLATTDQDMQDAFDWLDDKVHANQIAKKTWTNKSKAGGRVLYRFAVVLKKAYKEGKLKRVEN